MNPLKNMLAEYVFKGWAVSLQVEVRAKDTGEPTLYEHVVSSMNYGVENGCWAFGTKGIVKHPFNPSDELTFIPYHRLRNVLVDGVTVWRHDDPKAIPTNIPFAVESRR